MLWEDRCSQHPKESLYQTTRTKSTVSLFKVNFDLKKKKMTLQDLKLLRLLKTGFSFCSVWPLKLHVVL